MKKNFLLYGYGGAYNHGAEAIALSTIAFLKKKWPGCHITLSTHFIEQDLEFALPVDGYCVRDFDYVELDKQSDVKGLYNEQIYRQTIYAITRDTVCLSIGGDNYCYPNWQRFALIHQKALGKGALSLLWSCSIEPSAMTPEMMDVLKSHHLITARESLTYNALVERGLDNVMPCSDIAFGMKPKEVPLPDYFLPKNTVALNISPLVLRKEKIPGIAMENMQNLLDYIVSETDMNVVLLPHVMMPMDNDSDALGQLRIKDKSRVWMAPGSLSATQYKYIVSKCRFGVFARTHTSIAAYSSHVPCIAIGYSVKARGIAQDLGMQDYVLPIEQFDTKDKLWNLFAKLMQQEEAIIFGLKANMEWYPHRLDEEAVVSLINRANVNHQSKHDF